MISNMKQGDPVPHLGEDKGEASPLSKLSRSDLGPSLYVGVLNAGAQGADETDLGAALAWLNNPHNSNSATEAEWARSPNFFPGTLRPDPEYDKGQVVSFIKKEGDAYVRKEHQIQRGWLTSASVIVKK